MYAYQCVLVCELLSSQQSPLCHPASDVFTKSEMPDARPWAFLGLDTHNYMGT